MTHNLAIDGNGRDGTDWNPTRPLAERSLRLNAEVVFEVSLRRESDAGNGSPRRREAGILDVSHTIPNRLPEALRAASKEASAHAVDPFNELDYNPFIGDEWAIVAAEFQSLADRLDRRFHALFDGRDAHHRSAHLQPDGRSCVQEAIGQNSIAQVDCAIHRFAACPRGFLPASQPAERRSSSAADRNRRWTSAKA